MCVCVKMKLMFMSVVPGSREEFREEKDAT